MGIWSNDVAMDKLLTWINSTASKITINSSQPTTKAEATGAKFLAISTELDFSAIANSTMTAGGRKLTIQQTSDISISVAGTANHISLISGSTLVFVTSCTTRSLTTSDTATIPSWRIDINDPTT